MTSEDPALVGAVPEGTGEAATRGGLVDLAWRAFDDLVQVELTTPWHRTAGELRYAPHLEMLERLMTVPQALGAVTRSGLPAKAVDVWLSYELRRAGFDKDEVWPRPRRPRVLPNEVSQLLRRLPLALAHELERRIAAPRGPLSSVGPSEARVLGRAYTKQVDVVMAQWARGPELLISTKRMESSLGRNSFNRVEESYGDAHNLRGRFPLAVIGYVLVLNSRAMDQSPGPAARLIDLVVKMADDPAGYDAVCVIVAEWEEGGRTVQLRPERGVPDLSPTRFLQTIVDLCLERTPVDLHVSARELRSGSSLPVGEGESAID